MTDNTVNSVDERSQAAIDHYSLYPIYQDALDNLSWIGYINHLRTAFKAGAEWQSRQQPNINNSGYEEFIKFLDFEMKLNISDKKTIERIKWYWETYFKPKEQSIPILKEFKTESVTVIFPDNK